MTKQELLEKYNFRFDSDGYFQSCNLPADVGTCPCCDSPLVAHAEEWEVESKAPTGIKADCERELECFIENEHHEANRMPYVYWLPLETKAEGWVFEQLGVERQEDD